MSICSVPIYVLNRDLTPLKWKIKHKESWDTMCTSLLKKKYIYFHIHSRKAKKTWVKIWYNQNEIIKVFDKNISLYSIPKEHRQDVKDWLRDFYTEKVVYNKKKRDALNKKLSKSENEKISLIKMRSSWEITADEFSDMKNWLIDDIAGIKDQIIKLDNDDKDILENFDNMVELLVELSDKWKTKTSEEKVWIINTIVVELKIDDKKGSILRKTSSLKPFKKLIIINGGPSEVRTRDHPLKRRVLYQLSYGTIFFKRLS